MVSNRVFVYPIWVISLFLLTTSCQNKPGNSEATDGKDDAVVTARSHHRKGKEIDRDNTLIAPLTLAESNIKGHVKFISFRRYYVRRWGRKPLIAKGYFSYSPAGYLLAHEEYKADGTQTVACLYNYDNGNNPTDWKIMSLDNGRDSKIIFKYDKAGYKKEEDIDDKDARFPAKKLFKFDTAGNEVEEKEYGADSKLLGIFSFKYDNRGNQVEVKYRIAPNLAVFYKIDCSYDDSDNVTAGRKYGADTVATDKWTCKNVHGRCIEKDYFTSDDRLTMKNTFKYDTAGNMLEYNYLRANGTFNDEDSYSFQYVYDKAGNVIKQTRLIRKGGKLAPVECTEYDIAYY